jgi:chemosensory pili system protein ChpC
MSRDLVNVVLIALEKDSILLPNIAVAEVLSMDLLQKQGDGTGELAGHVQWNGRRIPVVNFEVLNGAPEKSEISRRTRVTLLHSLGGHVLETIGIITQGYPHLVSLNRDAVLSGHLRDADRSSLVLARVRIANQEALVPDFATLESELMRLQGVAEAVH